jgi:hypothetical protein
MAARVTRYCTVRVRMAGTSRPCTHVGFVKVREDLGALRAREGQQRRHEHAIEQYAQDAEGERGREGAAGAEHRQQQRSDKAR